MLSQNTLKQINRREWLRDATIAATSAAVMPALLIGCTDHPPGLGGASAPPSGPPLAEIDFYGQASRNLINMNAWLENVYQYTSTYEQIAYDALKGGKPKSEPPVNWKDIILDIFTEIAEAFLEAAEVEIPFVGPAIAIAGGYLEKWASGDERPSVLTDSFTQFSLGQQNMQLAISNKLLILADIGHTSDKEYPYQNLKELFKKGDFEFKGKKYDLKGLANANFPSEKNGTDFVKMRNAAYNNFTLYFWNAMFWKAGEINTKFYGSQDYSNDGFLPLNYAINTLYKERPADYFRGYYYCPNASPDCSLGDHFNYQYWWFTFDGNELTPGTAALLFQDSVPGRWINPDDKGNPTTGLFRRDFVFKQFVNKKTDFIIDNYHYYQIRNDLNKGSCDLHMDCAYFDTEEPEYKFPDGYLKGVIPK